MTSKDAPHAYCVAVSPTGQAILFPSLESLERACIADPDMKYWEYMEVADIFASVQARSCRAFTTR